MLQGQGMWTGTCRNQRERVNTCMDKDLQMVLGTECVLCPVCSTHRSAFDPFLKAQVALIQSNGVGRMTGHLQVDVVEVVGDE